VNDYQRDIGYGLERLRTEDGNLLPPLDVSQLSDEQLDNIAGVACCGIISATAIARQRVNDLLDKARERRRWADELSRRVKVQNGDE
jgi:hypothetical protein